MSDAKHTPGPWSFYDCAAYGSHITRGGIGGQMIASVQPYVGISADAYKANRALISAAPDMLAALEAVATWVNQKPQPHPFDAWEMARAAIAKARGA